MEYDYINERLNPQLVYYDTKSIKEQKLFHCWSIASIVCSALVPVATLVANWCPLVSILVALFGAGSTLSNSILLHYHFHERWIRFRSAHNELTAEREQFNARIGHYKYLDDDDAAQMFAEECERIMAKENGAWPKIYSDSKSASTSS